MRTGRLGLGQIRTGWDMRHGNWAGRGVRRRALGLRQEKQIKSEVSCFSDFLDLIRHVTVVLWEEESEVTCDPMTKAWFNGLQVTTPELELIHSI